MEKNVDPELEFDQRLDYIRRIHRASIDIAEGEKVLRAICEAISLEIKSPPNPDRVYARSSCTDHMLSIEIYAQDIPSLRAALNSYLYLLHTAIRSLEMLANR